LSRLQNFLTFNKNEHQSNHRVAPGTPFLNIKIITHKSGNDNIFPGMSENDTFLHLKKCVFIKSLRVFG